MDVLELKKWQINAYQPYVPIISRTVETNGVLGGILFPVDAEVPGSIYNDLYKAGVIRDPYYERNSLECAWVKDYWWIYETTFSTADIPKDRRLYLRFEGIDYKASIILNGKCLRVHTGTFIPCEVDITDHVAADGQNFLKVMLEQAPFEMGQIGRTSQVRRYKPRFTYRWDFAPMLVGIGLYDKVTLESSGPLKLEDSFVRSRKEEGRWFIDCENTLTAFAGCEATITYSAQFEGETVAAAAVRRKVEAGTLEAKTSLEIPDPHLWWPNGHGEQALYQVTVHVEADGRESDEACFQTGLRTLEYRRCEGASEDSLPYCPVINGKPIYIKGVNMVPLDSMHGAVSEEKTAAVLQAARDAHVNLVRVWGGGVIESECFYAACDRLGILILQDFLQSSSGIDSEPSKNPGFLAMLDQSARAMVKERRNHVCLTFWTGGNELTTMPDEKGGYCPVGYDDANIAMLKRIVDEYNPGVLMLPTTGSGPNDVFRPGEPGRNHDVHAPWKYWFDQKGFSCEYHKFYNNSDSQLHSEMGVDGMGNYETLKKILLPENLKVTDIGRNLTWRHRAEWWDTLGRDEGFFGKFEENELEEFIACSQMIQYEGVRYALEANRRRAFRNCGSILWQFNEPWPNISCTNVVDYYGNPKAAYYAVRAAYRCVAPTLRYDGLFPEAGESARFAPCLCNDGAGMPGVFRAVVRIGGEEYSAHVEEVYMAENGVTEMGSFCVTPPESGLMEICLEWHPELGRPVFSRYPFFVVEKGKTADRRYAIAFVEAVKKGEESAAFEEAALAHTAV